MRIGPVIVLACLVGSIVGAQEPPTWTHWQYSAPIDAGVVDTARLVGVPVPSGVTTRAASGWADLRVIDQDGHEVPYVLRTRLAATAAEWRATRLLDPSVALGEYTQAILDAGAETRVHNSMRLDVDDSEDFLSWVEVAGSDDAKAWRILRERAPIYSLRHAGMGACTDVTYPDSTARYVRARLLDGSRPHRVRAGQLAYEVTTTAELVPAEVALVTTNGQAQKSVWVSSPDAPRVPVAEVRFDTAQSAFDRPVTLETGGDDGAHWQHVVSGEIFRVSEHGMPHAALAIRIPEASAARWRVTVYNRSDAPIADLHPAFYAIRRRVVFRQEPGRQYQLLFGNPRAMAPDYEMARLTESAALDAARDATLGAAVANAGYTDGAPWSERHGGLLWLALAVAVLVMGFVVLRTLRKAG
jgi:hypothetical protein